jgi:hypothetical protein
MRRLRNRTAAGVCTVVQLVRLEALYRCTSENSDGAGQDLNRSFAVIFFCLNLTVRRVLFIGPEVSHY